MEIMADKASMESMDQKWAMSASMFKEEGEEWKQRRAAPLSDLKLQSNKFSGVIDTSNEEDHTRIFASLVPDEVIYNVNDYSKRNFDACLLFGDVSGFTDLCEKYNKTGKGGPSKLTQVLNSYIGAMVQEILSHEGDVLKFSGDAFIAMWKVSENLSMKDAVHEAIDTSLVIQKNYGRYQADQDVTIRGIQQTSDGAQNSAGRERLRHQAAGLCMEHNICPDLQILEYGKKQFSRRTSSCSVILIFANYDPYLAIEFLVKLAISCGPLVFSIIGNQQNSHYFAFGAPILEVKTAEAQSIAGDIVITKNAWQHVSPNEYLAEELKDGLHAKIYGVGPNWRNIQRTATYSNKDDRYSVLAQEEKPSDSSFIDGDADEDDELAEVSEKGSRDDSLRESDVEGESKMAAAVYTAADQYALRPAVNLCIRAHMLKDLKKYILEPVEKGILSDEPIEYLTEIRQVTILFINCKINFGKEVKPQMVIDIANVVYTTICNLVRDNYGCLNKVNIFDKDLMMLVIFGLRGLKHEMESQIALKCAKECFEQLIRMPYIIGVGAGVTTGKTYCGAFGHTLRREYTVISLIVNKAARLMCAYPDKVTCDRETFLHSKMESKNFILQEYKPLKGIVNPGPIYEFKEVERTRDVALTISTRPLLGREKEIDLYIHLFELAKMCANKKSDNEFYAMLVVQGESRQGKTRLLEEIIFSTDPSTPINRFTMTKLDSEKPYTAIRLLFNPLLRLSEKSTPSEKKYKIMRRFRNATSHSELYFLNSVFEVDFKGKEEYAKLDKSAKYKALKKVFKEFCFACFINFWMVAIDNAEYIDNESWILISLLVKMKLLFIVATMNVRSQISSVGSEILKMQKIKVIQMKPIDKWYHVGLACQMLDVEAIPPELEKVIQSRSNGNPGWVESFLISLLQSNGVFLKTVTRKMAYESGLVIPPLYMMIRLTKEEKDLWVKIMEEGGSDGPDSTRWKMYVDSCRESFPDLTIATTLTGKFDLHSAIQVCVLNPSFNIDEVEPELSMDVIILKTFDSLTSYEQLLIKCSAVLGDIFPRDMLMYIMSSSAVRLTALAVKKLFEIRVLTCARGDFIEGGLIFKERFKNPNEETAVVCECKGLIIDENCLDLPKYSSCGYLRFYSSTFRETTYNLLTHYQKREFHSRAIRYLEKETRKCRACGNGYFTRYMGNKLDYDLKARQKKKSKKKPVVSFIETGSSFASEEAGKYSIYSRDSQYSSGSHGTKDTYFGQGSIGLKDQPGRDTAHLSESIFNPQQGASRIIEDDEEEFTMASSGMAFNMIRKYKDDFNITKTFSDTDYSQCTCMLILSTMYVQLIEHCSGAGLVEKMMNAMIEYCYVCFESQNLPQTLKILDEAVALLDGPLKQTIELEWMITLKRGKLFTLMGLTRLKLGHIEEGHKLLQQAMDCYGISFPTNQFLVCTEKVNLKFQQKLTLYFAPKLYKSNSTDDDYANYCNDVSECLTVLCEYYLRKNQWSNAHLAALWALKQAVKTETDFRLICLAYANMINICTHYGDQSRNVALEVFAFEICSRKRTMVELEEMKAVSKMYSAIFFARAARSEIEKSIHIGYLLWRISSSTHTYWILLLMLPMLVQLILMRKHMTEAGNILQEISMIAGEDVDISGKCWYFGLCITFHLETGLIVLPFHACLQFSQGEGREPAIRDPDSKLRLIMVIWLWNIRTENWEGAFLWEEEAMRFKLERQGETSENLFTGLYFLEGLIVLMAKKMDRKSIYEVDRLSKRIEIVFSQMFEAGKLYHLKAYYHVCRTNNYNETFKMLKKALKVADKYGNELEHSWITFSQQAWTNKLPKQEKNFWKNHSEEDTNIEYNEQEEYMDRFGHFTLPIPIYL